MEVEDEDEVSSFEYDQLVTFMSHSDVLVAADSHPVEPLLELIHGFVKSLQLRVLELIVI